jgi:transcriptional regulator
MVRLTQQQIKILRLRRSGIEFKDMKAYHFSTSTAYDAFKRAQRNINAAIDMIELVVKEELLTSDQVHRLRTIARKL